MARGRREGETETPGGADASGSAQQRSSTNERNKTKTRVTVNTEEGKRTADKTPGEGKRREEGNEGHGTGEEVPTQQIIDDLLGAVTEAIEDAEREAHETQEDTKAQANTKLEDQQIRGTHEDREASARQMARNFLQTMKENTTGRLEGTRGDGTAMRRGKEPAP